MPAASQPPLAPSGLASCVSRSAKVVPGVSPVSPRLPRLREAIRTERRDKWVHFASQDLTRQQPPNERSERDAAVRHGLVVTGNPGELAHARVPIRRDRTKPEPRRHDLRLRESRKYAPRALQKLRTERIFRPGEVVRESLVYGIVVKQDVPGIVRARVDARRVHEASQRLAGDGNPD